MTVVVDVLAAAGARIEHRGRRRGGRRDRLARRRGAGRPDPRSSWPRTTSASRSSTGSSRTGPRRWGRPGLGGHPSARLRSTAGRRAPGVLEHGADPDLRDDEGRTPPTSAARGGRRATRLYDEVEAILAPRTSPVPRRAGVKAARARGHPGRDRHARDPRVRPSGAELRPGPGGQMYDNVHVGLWSRSGAVELVPGDAPSHAGDSTRRCGATRTGSTCAGNTSPVARASACSASSGASSPTTTRSRSSGCKAQGSPISTRLVSRALETGERLVSAGSVSPTIGVIRAARACAHRTRSLAATDD